jgi:mannose-6-phosphate isomerase-like protein (cupin superfamily)
MPDSRPIPVGVYELLADFDSRRMSVRVFRLVRDTEFVDRHRHAKSTQVYVALEGRVSILRDGVETALSPYEALEVPPGAVHAARSLDPAATVMNISVPPLDAADQAPLGKERHTPSFDLPVDGGDIDD